MNTTNPSSPQPSANSVFTALGLAVYACQLFEGTMLEVMASARELLEGTGDGRRYDASLEALSRKTLGQLLHDFRNRAEIQVDVDEQLQVGLEARNFIIHKFASLVGDDFANESKFVGHLNPLYDKLAIVITANSAASAVLAALGKAQSERSERVASELRDAANAMRESVEIYSSRRR